MEFRRDNNDIPERYNMFKLFSFMKAITENLGAATMDKIGKILDLCIHP